MLISNLIYIFFPYYKYIRVTIIVIFFLFQTFSSTRVCVCIDLDQISTNFNHLSDNTETRAFKLIIKLKSIQNRKLELYLYFILSMFKKATIKREKTINELYFLDCFEF